MAGSIDPRTLTWRPHFGATSLYMQLSGAMRSLLSWHQSLNSVAKFVFPDRFELATHFLISLLLCTQIGSLTPLQNNTLAPSQCHLSPEYCLPPYLSLLLCNSSTNGLLSRILPLPLFLLTIFSLSPEIGYFWLLLFLASSGLKLHTFP